jgi:hypothetical protein
MSTVLMPAVLVPPPVRFAMHAFDERSDPATDRRRGGLHRGAAEAKREQDGDD